MPSERVFLSLTHLDDPTRHGEYNAWHQLDHLPENRVLPGVAWGDRWVRTPACAHVSHAPDPDLRATQYAVMYGFREPAEESIRDWTDLNRRAIWWGRRPELAWTHRRPLGFFAEVTSYAAARVLVSPEAVVHRPHLGVHLTVSRLDAPESPAAERLMGAYDRVHVPRLLGVPGVAGCVTYRFASPASGFGTTGADDDAGLLLRLVFLDSDPVQTTQLIAEAMPEWIHGSAVDSGQERILLSSPFASISPWGWTWFDQDT